MAFKPLTVTIIALIVAGIAAVVIVPNVGNAPQIPASLAIQATSTGATASSTAPTGTVQLSFAVGGRVGSVNVVQGQAVKKGQLLAGLDVAAASSAIAQAKAALDLTQAQYNSAQLQYSNAETQQDTLVANALRTLLSSGLSATPTGGIDELHNPTITGTYTCSKTGYYEIRTYMSGTASNYSFTYSGLETGTGPVTYGTPQALGSCGLYITFEQGFSGGTVWDIDVPNTKSSSYQTDQNAYDLAVSTRSQTLSQLAASIGVDPTAPGADTASASIGVAKAAYDAALVHYADDEIVAPTDGTVSFIEAALKPGASVAAGQSVMSISTQ